MHRLGAGIAAMVAALGGLDALVFTGGVGERAPRVRELACARLSHIGLELDPEHNLSAVGVADADIGNPASRVRVLVVRAREDLEVACQVRAALGSKTR